MKKGWNISLNNRIKYFVKLSAIASTVWNVCVCTETQKHTHYGETNPVTLSGNVSTLAHCNLDFAGKEWQNLCFSAFFVPLFYLQVACCSRHWASLSVPPRAPRLHGRGASALDDCTDTYSTNTNTNTPTRPTWFYSCERLRVERRCWEDL